MGRFGSACRRFDQVAVFFGTNQRDFVASACEVSTSFGALCVISEMFDDFSENVLNFLKCVCMMKERCETKLITGNRMEQCAVT